MQRTISFTLNGKPARVTVDDERMLLWVLRGDLGLTGTKFGCGAALCGACTVVVDQQAVRSCSTPVKDVAGKLRLMETEPILATPAQHRPGATNLLFIHP